MCVKLPLHAWLQQETAAPKPVTCPPRRLLLIEDNRDLAHTQKELLELQGHQVMVAYNGQDGLAQTRSWHPEVVLCDIGLPGIDGFEVARLIRDDPTLNHIHLVALSGYAQPEDLEKAMTAGFDKYLAKPIDLVELAQFLAGLPQLPPP